MSHIKDSEIIGHMSSAYGEILISFAQYQAANSDFKAKVVIDSKYKEIIENEKQERNHC